MKVGADFLAGLCYFTKAASFAQVGKEDFQLSMNSDCSPKLSLGTPSSIIKALIDEISETLRHSL